MTGSSTATPAAWEALDAAIAGEVALSGSPTYEQGYRAYNARFHHLRPLAVVRCATTEDVAETISFLARHGLEHATRSGGHSFAGHSSTRGVVVDVSALNAVSFSAGTAVVGAGARLGKVYDNLGKRDRTIPGGSCPDVGIAGLALSGGLGILGRAHGVTSDRLINAEIVLADGRVVDCDDHRNPELFWALRGAGAGNFGVVTRLSFATVPAPRTTNIHLAWPHAAAPAVIDAWQAWAPNGPDEMAASLKVTVTGALDRPPSIDVYAALAGTESHAGDLVEELVARTGSDPTVASTRDLSYTETRRLWAQLGEDSSPDPPQQPHLSARSEYFRRPLPAHAVGALLDEFVRERAAGESRELDFMPWGGAYNRVGAHATAFVHRDEQFLLKHAVVTDPDTSANELDGARRWLDRSWATVHPYASGRTSQNFADPDLANWQDSYYGTNLPRLMQIKARYDPGNFFRFAQSIPQP